MSASLFHDFPMNPAFFVCPSSDCRRPAILPRRAGTGRTALWSAGHDTRRNLVLFPASTDASATYQMVTSFPISAIGTSILTVGLDGRAQLSECCYLTALVTFAAFGSRAKSRNIVTAFTPSAFHWGPSRWAHSPLDLFLLRLSTSSLPSDRSPHWNLGHGHPAARRLEDHDLLVDRNFHLLLG